MNFQERPEVRQEIFELNGNRIFVDPTSLKPFRINPENSAIRGTEQFYQMNQHFLLTSEHLLQ